MKPNFGELSQKMIELLSKGEIAVKNDDTDLTVKIIIASFPNDREPCKGHWEVYSLREGRIGEWFPDNKRNLPIYKATDFIIPQKFCLKIDDENRNEVKRIAYACGMDKFHHGRRVEFLRIGALYYFDLGGWSDNPDKHKLDYPLLTFDHFKLLFDGGEEEKEIEGYPAPFDLFGGRVKKGTIYKEKRLVGINLKEYVPADDTSPSNTFHLPAEIVETWEPIYKSPEVIIKVGACGIPVNVIPGKRIWVERNGKVTEIPIESLEVHIMDDLRNNYAVDDLPVFKLTSANFTVTLGNEKLSNVTLEEIQNIIQTYNQ